MVTPLVNQYTPVAVTRQSVGTTLSVLPDATALDAAPANGGALIAGFDATNSLQRNLRVDASGRLIVVTGAAGATAAFDSGAADETLTTDIVRAAVTGRDQSQAANAQNVPIEARDATVDGNFSKTLVGLFTNTRLSGWEPNLADWSRIASLRPDSSYTDTQLASAGGPRLLGVVAQMSVRDQNSPALQPLAGNTATNATNANAAGSEHVYTIARVFGRDTGASLDRTIEARGNNAAKASNFPRAGQGLLVNARTDISDQELTATDVAGNAVTLTIPAPGANLRQYVSKILIQKFANALLTAGSAPLIVTTAGTAGLPGTPSFNFPDEAQAAGALDTLDLNFPEALEASADNGTITIVAPSRANVIWKISAWWRNR